MSALGGRSRPALRYLRDRIWRFRDMALSDAERQRLSRARKARLLDAERGARLVSEERLTRGIVEDVELRVERALSYERWLQAGKPLS